MHFRPQSTHAFLAILESVDPELVNVVEKEREGQDVTGRVKTSALERILLEYRAWAELNDSLDRGRGQGGATIEIAEAAEEELASFREKEGALKELASDVDFYLRHATSERFKNAPEVKLARRNMYNISWRVRQGKYDR